MPHNQEKIRHYAKYALSIAENGGLLVIAAATIIAASLDVVHMIENHKVSLADLLLQFLYLEVLAMVRHYYESGKLPVRFPLYIAMVAMARYLILDVKDMDSVRMLGVSVVIVLMAAAVLLIRYGHVRFPYPEDIEELKRMKENSAKPE